MLSRGGGREAVRAGTLEGNACYEYTLDVRT